MTKLLSRITQIILLMLFVATLIVLLTLPWMLEDYLRWSMDMYIRSSQYRIFVLVFLLVIGAGVLWIAGELLIMLRTIDGNPFLQRNVSALKRMGLTAMGMAALFFIKCFFFLTPMTLACGVILLMCGLFALVLAGVFAQAVYYKEENDLTI